MYIRTKDGVYELVDTYYMCVDGVETYMYNDRGRGVEIRGGQILNQSETLEELCDLVRFKTKDSVIHYIDLHKNTIEDIVVHFGGKNIIIDSFRYCIETDKGLIYVAKMNENGELELL